MWELGRLLDAGRIPQLPLYLDSPMAKGASDDLPRPSRGVRRGDRRAARAHEAPLDYPGQQVVQNVEESKAIARAQPPYMIVASNGMLTGGRSVGHAERLLGDPSATVLFVGYQGEGTLGGHLVRGTDSARIAGHEIRVKATVRSLDGFSAHADEPELLDWLGNFIARPACRRSGRAADVYLVHGDPPAQAALLPKVEGAGVPDDRPRLAPDGVAGLVAGRRHELEIDGLAAREAMGDWHREPVEDGMLGRDQAAGAVGIGAVDEPSADLERRPGRRPQRRGRRDGRAWVAPEALRLAGREPRAHVGPVAVDRHAHGRGDAGAVAPERGQDDGARLGERVERCLVHGWVSVGGRRPGRSSPTRT